jgi:aspartate racemase
VGVSKIVRLRPVSRDQHQLQTIIDSSPAIPDRQEAILEDGSSPLPMLVETAKNLVAAQSDFIVIHCNPAQYWIEDTRRAVRIPVVDMIEETVKETVRAYPSLRTMGIMAATGTVQSRLYQRQLRNVGISSISPTTADPALMEAIYSIKAGDPSRASTITIEMSRRLIAAGTEAVICWVH